LLTASTLAKAMSFSSEMERQRVRYRCQTDLFFLAKEILGKDLTERTHRPVIDWFVKKDPSKTIAQQSRIKERLLLYPRGSYKSTLNICDCVQWIICFPDVRILVLTGADDLASAFVDELKDYFTLDREPTVFQELFPELCITARDRGNQGEFWAPAGINGRMRKTKDPTVFASSILANNSGWHVDVMKPDDVVTDKNSETITEINRITKKFKMVRKLLMPYGFRDTIGTPYSVYDCYADHLAQAEAYQKKYGHRVLNYLWRPAWWLKGTDYEIPTPEQTDCEENLELLFPEAIPYSFLRKEQHTDERSFYSQYLCRPVEASQVVFVEDDLRRHTCQHTQLPRNPKYYVAWDFAYSTKKGRDYTVGAVGALDEQNRLFIVHIVRGRFLPDELAYQVVKTIYDYRPEITGVENSSGARFLEMDILRHAARMGIQAPIDWFPVSKKQEAKELRVKELQTMLANDQLWFSASITCMDALYKEFVQFGGQHHHDDIPDAIAHLRRYLPMTALVTPEEQYKHALKTLRDKEMRDLIFGLGRYEKQEPEKPYVPPTTVELDGVEYPVRADGLYEN
jgi:predicted phage terminase large subunit-like protein